MSIHLNGFLIHILSALEATHKARQRSLGGRLVSSKSPSRVRDRDKGVAGRNEREYQFPTEGSLICLPGKSMTFYKKETEKIDFFLL